MPSDWSPFNDPLPFDRVLILGFVTQPPTSYHGNPEEPMVLCVRGVLTVAIDAAEAAPWQVVRLRAVLCAAEAHSSRVGHWPAWRPQWAAGV